MSEIKLNADSGGGTVSLKGPATTTSNAAVPFVLPVADGSAGQLLKTDGSKNLSFTTVSSGLTEADMWRITADFQGDADPVTSNWERIDRAGEGKLGTGLTQSSGVFSFPSTGWWQIVFQGNFHYSSDNRYGSVTIQTTVDDGSNWLIIASSSDGFYDHSSGSHAYSSATCMTLFDVTSTSNCKARFSIGQEDNSAYTDGSSDVTYTGVSFIRLGDT